MALSYKDAGVDIEAGNTLISRIKPAVQKTFDSNVVGHLGLFAGAYRMPTGYKNPVLLSATDGVGTKLRIAIDADSLDGVGIDLVAMCVNDLICSFATPMFFLDYYACAHLETDQAARVIEGIAKGCELASCALIGGETAEMPGMYQEGDFDLAGFAVGTAEEADLGRLTSIKKGDRLFGFASSGIHSNGYSLVRKLLFEELGMTLRQEFDGKPLVETLLAPTRIYVPEFLQIKDNIKGCAHITGGGLTENLPRILPDGLCAEVDVSSIPSQPIFELFLRHLEREEAYRTFNMGVGLVVVADPASAPVIEKAGGFALGEISQGDQPILYR